MPTLPFATALGTCCISWEGGALTGFRLPGAAEPAPGDEGSAPDFVRAVIARVRKHLAGELQDFADVPLDWALVGPFQRGVYLRTQAIKAGLTGTYGDIARAVGGGPETARAVGAALGANPWPLIVPCHRVVAADGSMTGFSAPGGIRTKARLLALEGAELLFE